MTMKCGVVVVVGGWKSNLRTWDEEGSGKRKIINYDYITYQLIILTGFLTNSLNRKTGLQDYS